MPVSGQLMRATWTLADQGIVSLGTFATNILLARLLAPAEYGLFALIFGILLVLQIATSSLLFYPLSVRRCVATPKQGARLMIDCLLLTVTLCVPLAVLLGGALIAFGHAELAAPAVLFFVMWQVQEAFRRGLLARFLHHTAVAGDTISYVGQVVAIGFLAVSDTLTLAATFYVMAATSACGAVLQAVQNEIRASDAAGLWCRARLSATLSDFWSIGSWSLGNNLVGALRIQVFPWSLAILFGTATVAPFQAAVNIANVINPVVAGLANLIPQAAAHAAVQGRKHAWRATRPYIVIGIAPVLVYCAVAFAFPDLVLRVVYGAASPYLDIATPVRLLIVASLVGYTAEMMCCFFHGVDAPRLAFMINLIGAAVAVVLALPLVLAFELVGCCIALIIANAVRLAVAHVLLARTLAHEQPQPA